MYFFEEVSARGFAIWGVIILVAVFGACFVRGFDEKNI